MFNLISQLQPFFKLHIDRFLKDEKGQTFVEYVMLIVLVALAVFLASPSITSAILGVFSSTSSALASPGGS